MPYININEYDKTIIGSTVNNNNNIVAIPINAVDGPSDKWVTIRSYDDFLQTFGNNPNTGSIFGNSWEYAANLLLRGMPVCVRRITHSLDQYGRNLEPLNNVNTAETYVYINSVKNLDGSNVINNHSKVYVNENLEYKDYNPDDKKNPITLQEANNVYYSIKSEDYEKLTSIKSEDGKPTPINDFTIKIDSDDSKCELQINGYKLASDNNTAGEVADVLKNNDENLATKLNAGKIIIKNTSKEPINISSFVFEDINDGYKYDSKIETIKANNKSLIKSQYIEFLDENGNSIYYPRSQYDTKKLTSYFVLKPGYSILINKIVKNGTIKLKLFNINETETFSTIIPFSIKAFEGNAGSYEISYEKRELPDNMVKFKMLPIITYIKASNDKTTESLEDTANNRINLFRAEYLAPGTNGNFINVAVKTIGGQGIYAYVYRDNQLLERLELASLRYTDSKTGRIKLLDTDANALDILAILLLKFNIMLPYNKMNYDLPILGNYVKLYLNPELLKVLDKYSNGADKTRKEEALKKLLNIIKSLCNSTGQNKCYLKNGTNPSDEDVQHEVEYCYYPLEDKYRYDIKFVSNGGYVDKIVYSNDYLTSLTIERRYVEDAMLNLVHARKDCVTYLDIPYDLHEDEVPYYFEHISSSYAAAYDPWCYISLETGGAKWMPPSFVQLYTHAKAISNGHQPYLPPAGVRRALVPEILSTSHDLTSKYITEWQNNEAIQFINPILWINGYDYTIYGQKTLYNVVNSSNRQQSALQNLNVRLVANDIKKLIFSTCLNLTFELNNLMTWNEFKSGVSPKLTTMLAEGVISNFEILMGKETMTVADLNSGHCVGTVRVSIVSAAIDWDINFEITPNSVTFFDQDYNG